MATHHHIVDLRSDTVTLPTDEMRQAMATAKVGDDVFGEDPTVLELEVLAADMFGKEAGLFVPSGTMGNLICAMTHCWGRGSLMYLGDQSHMMNWEQGGISQLGGIIPKSLATNPDGTFDVTEMLRIHKTGENFHNAKPELVAVENPINGKVLPLSFMKEVHDAARFMGIKIHLDGARIGNAVAALGCKPEDITEWADSASICLSKGLGAPVGSVIVGSKDFICRARRLRKALGGGMRQSGILAAAGIISLTKMMQRMQEDHDNANKFARGLSEIGSDIIDINVEDVQTNIVFFNIKEGIKCSEADFVHLMSAAVEGNSANVRLMSLGKRSVRAVFHNGISEKDVELALQKYRIVCDIIGERQ